MEEMDSFLCAGSGEVQVFNDLSISFSLIRKPQVGGPVSLAGSTSEQDSSDAPSFRDCKTERFEEFREPKEAQAVPELRRGGEAPRCTRRFLCLMGKIGDSHRSPPRRAV